MSKIFSTKLSEEIAERGGSIEDIALTFKVFAEKMPEIIEDFSRKPLATSIERGNLEPKVRELVLLGMLAVLQSGSGLVYHIQAAVKEGASEKEIMEVIYLAAYEQAKGTIGAIGESIEEGFRRASKMKKD